MTTNAHTAQGTGEQDTRRARVLRGTVTSTKMRDTATVAVERFVKHPKYKKYMRRTKKYLVHDPGNTCTEGQKVVIREVPPVSKCKHFAIVAEG